MKKTVPILVAASLLLGTGCASGDQSRQNTTTEDTSRQGATTQQTGKGPTVAPDLLSVGGFRPGPETDDGEPTTLVDFAFDQDTYLTGGDRTNFKLVPKDGSDVRAGAGKTPGEDKRGDDMVSVVFPGQLVEREVARGYVDAGKVSSSASGDGPANVLQAGRIGTSGGTPAPDLAPVSRDGGKLLFEFDAKIDPEQVNDTGGFRAYDAGAKTYKGNTAKRAGSDPRKITVTFDDFDVSEAVGASVNQGAVEITRNGGELPNVPDEVPVSSPADGEQ